MASTNEANNVKLLAIVIGFASLLLFVIFSRVSGTVLFTYFMSALISYLVYTNKDYVKYAVGINKKEIITSTFAAVILGGVFYAIAQLIPGFSLGVPQLSYTIAEDVRKFIIVGLSPILETLFIQGALFAVTMYILIEKINIPKRRATFVAVFVQAVAFSLMHLSAYIIGFYNYPSFSSALPAIFANAGAFIAAFLFSLIAMGFAVREKAKYSDLTFIIIFHMIVNFIIVAKLSIVV